MTVTLEDRIAGIVYGLAFGEGTALPSATHRLSILAPKRVLRMKSLGEFADNQKQTTRPFPYTHAQASHMLDPSPSDDTEWFAFVADYLLSSQDSLVAWRHLAEQSSDIQARTGTKIAFRNLLEGKNPPASGHDNPHYFDDIAMIRALAIAAVYSRDNDLLTNKVLADTSITHSEDGVFCALAVAHLIASLLRGESISQASEVALQQTPKNSWSHTVVHSMINRSAGTTDLLARYTILETSEIENIYAYPVSAPETLGLLLAHLQHCEDAKELLFSGLLHKRKLDSLPALMGAVAGAHFGTSWIPSEHKSAIIQLDGVSIPKLKGMTLGSLVARLSKGI